MYKELSASDGIKYLPKIWTVLLTDDPEFNVQSFTFRELRLRCYFDFLNKEIGDTVSVYFHLGTDELFKDMFPNLLPKEINFYGAYNQINVCQMKSHGYIQAMNDTEKEKYLSLMQKRMSGIETGDEEFERNFFGDGDYSKALKMLESGNFFRFDPITFEHDSYERG
jgi:hypothetical protein